jgi:predicted transcriptional regulator
MSPPAAAALLEPAPVSAVDDPVWAAMLASPIAEDDLTDEERAGLEEAEADVRAGRVVSHEVVLATIEGMRRAAGG